MSCIPALNVLTFETMLDSISLQFTMTTCNNLNELDGKKFRGKHITFKIETSQNLNLKLATLFPWPHEISLVANLRYAYISTTSAHSFLAKRKENKQRTIRG